MNKICSKLSNLSCKSLTIDILTDFYIFPELTPSRMKIDVVANKLIVEIDYLSSRSEEIITNKLFGESICFKVGSVSGVIREIESPYFDTGECVDEISSLLSRYGNSSSRRIYNCWTFNREKIVRFVDSKWVGIPF